MADYSGSGISDGPRGRFQFVRRARLSPSLTGRLCLTKDMNCASATLEAFQDLAGLPDDPLLAAVTGLEGGVVASGSTCGVVTAGVIGIAQVLEREAADGGGAARAALTETAGDYVRWFGDTFGTTVCRERTGVDFYTAAGQIRYFIPGDRVLGCTAHIGTAVDHLWRTVEGGPNVGEPIGRQSPRPPLHCAGAVLSSIRERTGVGDVRIEDLSVVLDGGVGLTGGSCGALLGAVMGTNLVFGMDARKNGYLDNVRAFAAGHINLLLKTPRWMPEPFGIGREIVSDFRERAGSLECRAIIGRGFRDLGDFTAHMDASDGCRRLIGLGASLAESSVTRWGKNRTRR